MSFCDAPATPVFNPNNLEINAVEHCNIACSGCSHLSPIAKKRAADPETLRADLAALKGIYSSEAVKLVGGEPLLHPELARLLEIVAEASIARRISICTNGLLLGKMDPAVWRLIDHLEVSCYPETGYDSIHFGSIRREAEQYGVTLKFVKYVSFRRPYIEDGRLDAELTLRVFGACQVAHHWRCHTVSDGRFYRCPQALLLGRRFGKDGAEDGVDLHSPDLEARLAAYLAATKPLAACCRCLGTVGRSFAHHQVRRGAWADDQKGPLETLIDYDRLAELETDITGEESGDCFEWDPV